MPAMHTAATPTGTTTIRLAIELAQDLTAIGACPAIVRGRPVTRGTSFAPGALHVGERSGRLSCQIVRCGGPPTISSMNSPPWIADACAAASVSSASLGRYVDSCREYRAWRREAVGEAPGRWLPPPTSKHARRHQLLVEAQTSSL